MGDTPVVHPVYIGVLWNGKKGPERRYTFLLEPYNHIEENGAQFKYPFGPYPRGHQSYTLTELLAALAHPVISWNGSWDRRITHVKVLYSPNYHSLANIRSPVYPLDEYISMCQEIQRNPDVPGLVRETMEYCFGLRKPGTIKVGTIYNEAGAVSNVRFEPEKCIIRYYDNLFRIEGNLEISFKTTCHIHRCGSNIYLTCADGKFVIFTPETQA
jgi:hypothetical protein